jgi:UDP-2-acetamido-3-amino-2,3-dideoxy-glucuronate N-acetyltransferase
VTGDVPDFALVAGVPAKQKGWMCKCAVRLNFAGGKAKCETCGESYVLENGVVREA